MSSVLHLKVVLHKENHLTGERTKKQIGKKTARAVELEEEVRGAKSKEGHEERSDKALRILRLLSEERGGAKRFLCESSLLEASSLCSSLRFSSLRITMALAGS